MAEYGKYGNRLAINCSLNSLAASDNQGHPGQQQQWVPPPSGPAPPYSAPTQPGWAPPAHQQGWAPPAHQQGPYIPGQAVSPGPVIIQHQVS